MYNQEGLLALFASWFDDRGAAHAISRARYRAKLLAQVEHADRVCNGAGVCVEARR